MPTVSIVLNKIFLVYSDELIPILLIWISIICELITIICIMCWLIFFINTFNYNQT